jgi:allophanate hydrolase
MTLEYAAQDLSIASLRRRYAAGTASPADVLQRLVARSDAYSQNPAFIHRVALPELLAQADALERRRERGESLPLYGIPFAVKDNIDVAGQPTTAACATFSHVPAVSAASVARLEQAGAICVGKTNLDQFATGLTGIRSPYGACASVFHPDYPAGGSSSGSAVAVAAGLASFALGTDTGGSGRVPAGFNNIVGLKPTLGRVSSRGLVPNCRTLDTVSVFALDCADATEVLRCIEGFDPLDAFSRRQAADRGPVAADSEPWRFGVPRPQDLEFFGDADAAALFAAAIRRLEALGTVREIDFTPFRAAGELLFDGPWIAERTAALQEFLARDAAALLPVTRAILESGRRWSAVDAFEQLYRLKALARQTDAVWDAVDLLVVPTAATTYPIAAIEADPIRLNNRFGYYSYFVNLLDLRAVAVPNGFLPNGVAMGVTIIAPAWHDDRVAAAGSAYQLALDVAPDGPAR